MFIDRRRVKYILAYLYGGNYYTPVKITTSIYADRDHFQKQNVEWKKQVENKYTHYDFFAIKCKNAS